MDTFQKEIAALKESKTTLETYLSQKNHSEKADLMTKNVELTNLIYSTRKDAEEKKDEAAKVYQKALGIMEASNKMESPTNGKKDNLEEYMLNALAAPMTSSVFLLLY